MNPFYKWCRAGRAWRPAMISIFVLLAMTGLAAAQATKPAYLTESRLAPVPSGLYQFWYTSTCNGDPACDCDNQAKDLDGDGVAEPDQSNSCIATDPDADGVVDGVYDTIQDANNNGVPDLVDPAWLGGGSGTGEVTSLATSLQLALDVYTEVWGLRPPYWDPLLAPTRDLWLYDLVDDDPSLDVSGYAYPDGSRVELDTEWMLFPSNVSRATVTHELWHMTQYAYAANVGAGDWLVEGQARLTEDRVFPALDTDGGSSYLGSVNYYLRNPTYPTPLDTVPDGWQAQGLLGANYEAALWWAYLAEQAGTDFVGTAGEGMDFLKTVLEQSAIPPLLTGFAAVDYVLRTHIGRGFDDTFWDFTIANYAKDVDITRLDPSDLDGRDPQAVLRYRDELEANAPAYGKVLTQEISAADLKGGSKGGIVEAARVGADDIDAMPAYGAKYFEVTLPETADCLMATWQVLNADGAQLMHSLLVLSEDSNGDNQEEVISLDRHQGEVFARGLPNRAEYTGFVGIVATGSEAAGFTWEVSCTEPQIEIVEPTALFPAPVGYPTEPGRFLLWLEVKDSHTTDSVSGLDWQRDFAVKVGGLPATILNGDTVQNQYWLLVQAPDIPGAALGDTFSVAVDLLGTSATDSVADAVIYDLIPKDQILVLDRSGSMADQDKLDSAKSAARLYTDAIQQLDQIGVVSFSNTAIKEFDLTQAPDQDDGAGVRTNAKSAIDSIMLGNLTGIGAGLRMGQNMLNANGRADNQPWMVLLSDGLQSPNLLPPPGEVVMVDIIPHGTKVQTLALGADADSDLMHGIALLTCGRLVDYCYHALDNDGLPVSSAAVTLPDLTNKLADIYRRMGETVANHQSLWQDEGQTSGNFVIPLIIEEEGGREAFFSFNWIDAKNPLNVTISGPSGVTFTPLSDGANHTVFYVPQLVGGDYTITLNGTNQWIGSLSARVVEGTEMHAFVDNTEEERKVLLPAQLQVSLSDDKGPITGAAVVATVYRFDKTVENITLHDDGVAPHDAQPHDGVYGYSYDRVNGVEGYDITFDILATGDSFTRYQRLTYRPTDTSHPDRNNDGLVDTWQQRYKVVNATDDPDHDDLTNLEEMNLGTDPRYADTDRGGEHDGSEVEHARNPLGAEDDALPPITDFRCQPHPGAVTLHFNPRAEYGQIRIFRNTNAAPVAPLGIFPPGRGVITDTVVTNGQNYAYFIQALGAGNVRGGYSSQRLCQPDVDPYPPMSDLVINNDADATGSTTVTLHFNQSYTANGVSEITAVKLSNTPDLLHQKWQPFAETIAWQIEPDPATGWAYVYALVRDAAGNVSESVLSDGILYNPALAQQPAAPPRANALYLPMVAK